MPRELRVLFTSGPGTGLSAQEVFTNRGQELEAFQQSLSAYAQSRRSIPSPVTEMGIPRTNVLVYYGLGGIGKTTLSRQLEQRFVSEESEELGRRASIRVDFGEGGGFDLETFILRLRAGLALLSARWQAFDIALSVYWERAHPGEPLREFLEGNSLLHRVSQRVGLADQIEETVVSLIGELGASWAPIHISRRVANFLYERISRAVAERRLLADCPFFKPLIEAEGSEETLSYLPSLLAWDLEELQHDAPTSVVVFLDTFEALGQRTTRDVERLVQRTVFLLPNALFVVTGRNRLDWADLTPPGELDYLGSTRWPYLNSNNRQAEPRQHLVGYLSPLDCDDYLQQALRREGEPEIGDDVREAIASASEGLPLYLDLAVSHYIDILAREQVPHPSDFRGPLASIVARIMRDVGDEERKVLRGVSLLDSFDEDLARAASGASDSCIRSFVRRPFVEHTLGQPWPYALHSLLRKTIREVDNELRDAWSAREWQDAGQRLLTELGAKDSTYRSAKDRVRAAAAFTQGVRVASHFGLCPAWIVETANLLADAGMWRALDVAVEQSADTSPITALRSGLQGIMYRRTGSLQASLRSFKEALSSQHLTNEATNLLALHRTHTLRNAGFYDDAEREYRQIAAGGGPYAENSTVQLADIELLRGRFADSLASLEAPPKNPFLGGEALRLRGHVHRFNCQLHLAEGLYRRAQEQGKILKSLALEGKAATNLAETLCWLRPVEVGIMTADALDFNRAIGNQLEITKAYAARAVAEQGPGALQRAEAWVEESLRTAQESGYRAGGVFALAARLFQRLLADDFASAVHTRTELLALTTEIGVYRFWGEIVDWWLSELGVELEPIARQEARWLDGQGAARRRWIGVLLDRRRGRGA